MDSPPTLTVRGRATAPARPDHLVVHLAMSVTAPTSAEALLEAGDQWRRLAAVLDDLHIEEVHRSGSSVAVNPYHEPSSHRGEITGWTASGQMTVQLTSADVATELVDRAVTAVDARVSAWNWVIAPDNPAHTEAGTRAVAQARARADALASALGYQLGTLLSASDAETSGPRYGQFRTLSGASSPGGSMPVQEGWAEVSAVVELTFALGARG